MKRSTPLFARIDFSDSSNDYIASPSEGSSLLEGNYKMKGNSCSQNSDSSYPSFLAGHSDRLISCGPRTPVLRPISSNLVRSKSIPSIKFGNDGNRQSGTRLKLTSSGSGERTPVSHFSTPQRKSGGRILQDDRYISKLHGKYPSDQQIKTPLKRYFSEAQLNKPSATPDCFSNVHMETPKNKSETDLLPIALGEETSNLTVGVRVRPLSAQERKDPAVASVLTVDGSEVQVICDTGIALTFTYDLCFWSCDPHHPQYASQDVVFTTMVQPLIDTAFLGYNACLFAYGQTGSGKSYSMMGLGVESRGSIGREVGIIPRFCHELFERIASLEDSNVGCGKTVSESASVEISYFEIYNEKIHDLLGESSDGGKRAPLKVREHPQFGPYVVDLSVHGVTSYEDLQSWLSIGNSQRATAATGMNEKSSRSHSIFSIILTQTQEETVNGDTHKHSRRSKINLVDLAGSERLSHTCASGDRLREGVSINRSLLTLGKVIAALAENGNSRKKGFVPYRDSILTWLLRESLGGNSRTTMLATVSPANIHVDETLATLRYACQARTIVNRVRVNEDPHDRLIRELRAEIQRLRSLREDCEQQRKAGVPRQLQPQVKNEPFEEELESLKKQLKEREEQLVTAQKTLAEHLEEAEKHRLTEMNILHRPGVALQLEKQTQPCLVNLVVDPSRLSTLLYFLPAGNTCIGQLITENTPHVAVTGPCVKPHDCTIRNEDNRLTLEPCTEAEAYVNGEAVTGRVSLHHGDRLVISGIHYFRVSNPHESSSSGIWQVADFSFAHQEILRIKDEKLQAMQKAMRELDDMKIKVEKQLESQKLTYEQQLDELKNNLEQQKRDLAESQKIRDEFETHADFLEAECQRLLNRNNAPEEITTLPVPEYNSDFLQRVTDALNETVVFDSSNDSSSSDLSLNNLTVGVDEANDLCKPLGIKYKFHLVQVLGKSLVKVQNENKGLVSFWKPSNFLQWLQDLRDHDPNENLNRLLEVEESWEEDNDTTQLSLIRKMLNESSQQLSMEASECSDSALERSHNSLMSGNATYHDCCMRTEDLDKWLAEMETTSGKLKRLCKHQRHREDVKKALRSFLRTVSQQLQSALSDSPTNSLISNSYIHYQQPDIKPGKSNLRSPGLTPTHPNKNVRFFLSESQLIDSPQ